MHPSAHPFSGGEYVECPACVHTMPTDGASDAVTTVAPFAFDDPESLPAKNFEFDASTIVGGFDGRWAADLVAQLARRAAAAWPGDPAAPLFPNLTAARWAIARREWRAQHVSAGPPFSPRSFRRAGPSHNARRHQASAAALQTRGRWFRGAPPRPQRTGTIPKFVNPNPRGLQSMFVRRRASAVRNCLSHGGQALLHPVGCLFCF